MPNRTYSFHYERGMKMAGVGETRDDFSTKADVPLSVQDRPSDCRALRVSLAATSLWLSRR